MRRWLLMGLLLAQVPQAWASKIIGNGGMVVVCSKGPSSVQLLDFYEAQELHDLKIVDPGGVSYQDKFMALVGRLSLRFPNLAKKIIEEFTNFERHQRILPNVVLQDTMDAYTWVLPVGCHLEQIAIQRQPMFRLDPWFVISQDLWDGMDELNKAGLALHEVLYHMGVEHGLEHSIGIRYLVGLMFSSQMENVTDEDWITSMQQSRMESYEVEGMSIPLFTGPLLPCKRLPGATECESRPPEVAPGEFHFNAAGIIQQVSYHDSQQDITFMVGKGTTVSLSVSDVRFDWNRPDVNLITSGVLTLSNAASGDPNPTHSYWFRGRLNPIQGLFLGSESPINALGGKPASPVNYSGMIQALGYVLRGSVD